MYCVKCGEEIDNGTVQCPYCGTDQVAHFKITYGNKAGESSVISDSDKKDGAVAKAMRAAKWIEDKIPQEKMKEIKDKLEPYVDGAVEKVEQAFDRVLRDAGDKTGIRKKPLGERIGDGLHDIRKKKKRK